MTHPGPPEDLQALAGDGEVDLSWTLPIRHYEQPLVYRIYRGTDAENLALLEEVGGVLTYRDTNVSNGVTYYYESSAVNEAGESPRSGVEAATPTDTTPPAILITSPQDGAVVASAMLAVSGTASDNEGVERVELSRDGVTWQLATGTASWSGTLTLDEGPNVVTARAIDTFGNTVTDVISVTVSSEPPSPDGLSPWIIVGGVAVAVAAVGIIVVLWRRRR